MLNDSFLKRRRLLLLLSSILKELSINDYAAIGNPDIKAIQAFGKHVELADYIATNMLSMTVSLSGINLSLFGKIASQYDNITVSTPPIKFITANNCNFNKLNDRLVISNDTVSPTALNAIIKDIKTEKVKCTSTDIEIITAKEIADILYGDILVINNESKYVNIDQNVPLLNGSVCIKNTEASTISIETMVSDIIGTIYVKSSNATNISLNDYLTNLLTKFEISTSGIKVVRLNEHIKHALSTINIKECDTRFVKILSKVRHLSTALDATIAGMDHIDIDDIIYSMNVSNTVSASTPTILGENFQLINNLLNGIKLSLDDSKRISSFDKLVSRMIFNMNTTILTDMGPRIEGMISGNSAMLTVNKNADIMTSIFGMIDLMHANATVDYIIEQDLKTVYSVANTAIDYLPIISTTELKRMSSKEHVYITNGLSNLSQYVTRFMVTGSHITNYNNFVTAMVINYLYMNSSSDIPKINDYNKCICAVVQYLYEEPSIGSTSTASFAYNVVAACIPSLSYKKFPRLRDYNSLKRGSLISAHLYDSENVIKTYAAISYIAQLINMLSSVKIEHSINEIAPINFATYHTTISDGTLNLITARGLTIDSNTNEIYIE